MQTAYDDDDLDSQPKRDPPPSRADRQVAGANVFQPGSRTGWIEAHAEAWEAIMFFRRWGWLDTMQLHDVTVALDSPDCPRVTAAEIRNILRDQNDEPEDMDERIRRSKNERGEGRLKE